MPDVLVRDVPLEVVSALDATAKRLGLSRADYLRRELRRLASSTEVPVTVADLQRAGEAFQDLADPEIMRGAWG